jgi:hypothetical protein
LRGQPLHWFSLLSLPCLYLFPLISFPKIAILFPILPWSP